LGDDSGVVVTCLFSSSETCAIVKGNGDRRRVSGKEVVVAAYFARVSSKLTSDGDPPP
jgi:hypothetical protein